MTTRERNAASSRRAPQGRGIPRDREGRAAPHSRARRARRAAPAIAGSLGTLTRRPYRPRSSQLALAREQRALALDPPAIAGQLAVAADDAVARHQQRQLVAGAGLRDGAHRLRPAERGGDLAVGRGPPRRDLLQGAPDQRLEGGAADVERQIGLHAGRRDKLDDALGPAGQRAIGRPDQRGREAPAQFGFEGSIARRRARSCRCRARSRRPRPSRARSRPS